MRAIVRVPSARSEPKKVVIDFDAKVADLQVGDYVRLTDRDAKKYADPVTGAGEEVAKGAFRIEALTESSARVVSTINPQFSIPGIVRRGLKRVQAPVVDGDDEAALDDNEDTHTAS